MRINKWMDGWMEYQQFHADSISLNYTIAEPRRDAVIGYASFTVCGVLSKSDMHKHTISANIYPQIDIRALWKEKVTIDGSQLGVSLEESGMRIFADYSGLPRSFVRGKLGYDGAHMVKYNVEKTV